MLPYAPGARVLIRDEEWLVRRVDPSNDEGYLLSCCGLSELVRGRSSQFLTVLEERIVVLDPAKTECSEAEFLNQKAANHWERCGGKGGTFADRALHSQVFPHHSRLCPCAVPISVDAIPHRQLNTSSSTTKNARRFVELLHGAAMCPPQLRPSNRQSRRDIYTRNQQ
jgi:hypothetical protein